MPTDTRSGGALSSRATKRVLTGASMSHKIKFLGAKQVRYQLDNQTTAIIRWDIARVRCLIASVRRLTMQGNKVVFEEEHSYIENRNGNRTELEAEGHVYWLKTNVLNGVVDGKMQCAMNEVEMRALEDRAERLGPLASSSSTQPMNIREGFTHAETHEPMVRVRFDAGIPSESDQDEHNATHHSVRSWCAHCVTRATQASQFTPRRARNADGLLLHETQDGQRADGGAQLPGLRVTMYVRLCRQGPR